MIDEGLETMNISILRGHVVQLTQSISQLSCRHRRKRLRKEMMAVLGMI
jgi:hypothetical protein